VTKGVQARARAAGFVVIIADSDEDPGQETELVRNLSDQVDGVMLCSPRAPDSVLIDLARERTLVLINRSCGDLPSVAIDNREGVRQAMTHLHALGHRTIAYVGGPTTSWSNAARLDALHTVAAQKKDLEVIYLGSFPPYVSGGVAAADLVIASGATAVLAFNDLVAFGLLDRFRRRGIDVPGDISVVGVDDLPLSALTYPSLTSVGIPLVSCGRAGVDVLLSVIRNEPGAPVHHQDLSFQLAVRASTGPVGPNGPRRGPATA